MGNVYKKLTGISGSLLSFRPGSFAGHPVSGLHRAGTLYLDSNSDLWCCIATGNPGTWTKALDLSTGVPLSSVFCVRGSRNATSVTDLWMRGSGNVPFNKGPIAMPFNSRLVYISATTANNSTETFEIYKNADVRGGGVPNQANAVATLAMSNTKSAFSDLTSTPVSFLQGDEVGVFMRGNAIKRPAVTMFFAREF